MKQQLQYKDFEIKSVDFNEKTEELTIKGYAATFNNVDSKQWQWHPDLKDYVQCSDTITQGAFAKTLAERKERVAFCKNHDLYDPKGKITELKEDSIGLYVEIRISDAEPELKTKLKEGIFTEFSIGFVTLQSIFEKQSDDTYLRKLTEVKLYEVSVVTIARDVNARITEIKSLELIDSLLAEEKNETKKYKLLQLKSLYGNEPPQALDKKEPIKDVIDFDKLNFKN